MYKSIFLRTAGALALTALLAAQTMAWTKDQLPASATILGWSLLAALVGGLVAVAWAFVGQPATSALGRALRSGVQALLAAPIAGAAIHSYNDVIAIGDLVVPTAAAVLIAFGVSYLSNLSPAPHQENVATGADFLGILKQGSTPQD